MFGDLPVSAIRPSAVQGWVSGLPLSPKAAKEALTHVSSVFRAAVRDRVVTANPCNGAVPPPARRHEMWIPDLATVQALREHLPERYRGVIDLVAPECVRVRCLAWRSTR